MAYDKIVNSAELEGELTGIANELKAKTGKHEPLDFYKGDFRTAIGGLEKAVNRVMIFKEITENGEYTYTPEGEGEPGSLFSSVYVRVDVGTTPPPVEPPAFIRVTVYAAPDVGCTIFYNTPNPADPWLPLREEKTLAAGAREQIKVVSGTPMYVSDAGGKKPVFPADYQIGVNANYAPNVWYPGMLPPGSSRGVSIYFA